LFGFLKKVHLDYILNLPLVALKFWRISEADNARLYIATFDMIPLKKAEPPLYDPIYKLLLVCEIPLPKVLDISTDEFA
jgi:hypothetical protein